jgi:hypothetical protein
MILSYLTNLNGAGNGDLAINSAISGGFSVTFSGSQIFLTGVNSYITEAILSGTAQVWD